MTLHVGAGFSAIWAGNVKNGCFVGTKTDVTDDVLNSAAIWLEGRQEEVTIVLEDRKITLKTETKYLDKKRDA